MFDALTNNLKMDREYEIKRARYIIDANQRVRHPYGGKQTFEESQKEANLKELQKMYMTLKRPTEAHHIPKGRYSGLTQKGQPSSPGVAAVEAGRSREYAGRESERRPHHDAKDRMPS